MNWLPWILRIKRPGHKFGLRSASDNKAEKNVRFKLSQCQTSFASLLKANKLKSTEIVVSNDDLDVRINKCLTLINDNPPLTDESHRASLVTMQQIYYELQYVTERMKRDDEAEERKNDWK